LPVAKLLPKNSIAFSETAIFLSHPWGC
jgi:hypothetical protein